MNLLETLYDALREPLGIVVETNDVERLRQKLYALRKDHPDLADLSLVPSPTTPNQLWILKRNPNGSDD